MIKSKHEVRGQIFYNKSFALISILLSVGVMVDELRAPAFGPPFSVLLEALFSLYFLMGMSWLTVPSVKWEARGIYVRHYGVFPWRFIDWENVKAFRSKNVRSLVLSCNLKSKVVRID